MPQIVKATWADRSFVQNEKHLDLMREFASVHVLCKHSCRLILDVYTADLKEETKNSAFHWSRCFEWPWALLNADLKPDDVVMDAGGGGAVFQYIASKCCKELINYDGDGGALSMIADMQKNHQIGLNIKPHLGDLLNIPFPDATFDKVICVSVVEHIPDWQRAVDNLLRITKPGGILILTMDVNINPKPSHEFRIDKRAVATFIQRYGGEVPYSEYVPACGMPDGSLLCCLCLKFVA